MKLLTPCLAALLLSISPAAADEPEVVDVTIRKSGMMWTVSVALLHPDTGWDHYADGWEVLDAGGNRLGYRKLMHPHVDEQPFTRSLSGVVIPDGVREVFVRPSCSRDGWAGQSVPVKLSP
jgi:hypothetical protein